MKITEGAIMRVREHHGYGHGLRPGNDSDINCPSCRREDGDPFEVGMPLTPREVRRLRRERGRR